MNRSRLLSFGLILAAAVTLTACSGTRALYSNAETPVQFAKAALQHHNAVGLEVANLVADPEVSASTKEQLRTAYRTTVCSSAELQAGDATADCNEGPAYKADDAIRAYELAGSAQSELAGTPCATPDGIASDALPPSSALMRRSSHCRIAALAGRFAHPLPCVSPLARVRAGARPSTWPKGENLGRDRLRESKGWG